MATKCLAIVGVGLMGGSIGLAARRSGRFGPILGVDNNPTNLETALERGCIDEGSKNLPAIAKRADIIVVCTPVDTIAEYVLKAAKYCKPEALITDTGSTKAAIVETIERDLPAGRRYAGAHPLCGSEKRGPSAARVDLYDGRLTILTPLAKNFEPMNEANWFWMELGCRTIAMSPTEHDEMLSLTSHLPHVVASALAGLLEPKAFGFAATGFRDTTRLAAGDPALWTGILLQNAENVTWSIRQLQLQLTEYRKAIRRQDSETIHRLLTEAKGIRDDLGS